MGTRAGARLFEDRAPALLYPLGTSLLMLGLQLQPGRLTPSQLRQAWQEPVRVRLAAARRPSALLPAGILPSCA